MPCNRPLPAWRARAPNPETGRLPVVFQHALADTSLKVEVPCGRCMGCRLERARTWACRMVHESKLYPHNYFITLTYEEAALPRTVQGLPTLQPIDFVLFMKRLRIHAERNKWGLPAPLPPGRNNSNSNSKLGAQGAPAPSTNSHNAHGIRYYQCGEYGERTNRPHHHAILFNCPLPDLRPIRTARTSDAHTLYTSKVLEQLWQHGIISVGAVTFETAAYVAAYVTKKITGAAAAAHYQGRVPEYSTMSRRPGIGRDFLEKFKSDIYPSDEVIIRGHPMRPPKFYDRILEKGDPETFYQVRDARNVNRADHRSRNAREVTLQQKQKAREFE